MSDAAPDDRELKDLQGNLVGFNKDHQRLVFLSFPGAEQARAFLADLQSELASAWEVKRFNQLFKELYGRRHAEPGIIKASWTNLALSFAGLQVLGAEGLDAMPEEFRAGMAARAEQVGDKLESAPGGWLAPFVQGEPHAMAILAADDPQELEENYARLQAACQRTGVTEVMHIDGNVRPGEARGKEHFGFKDGISQPSIRGVTKSSKGGEEIAAGEFIVGYPDRDGNVSGQPLPAPPQPGQPGYNPIAPPPPPAPLPDWTHNGSFVVFRRLRQDVAAFRRFMAEQAAAVGLSPDLLAAKMVGRWHSGAPLEAVGRRREAPNPADGDPAASHPELLEDSNVNNFDYEPEDADGHLVPRAAHIRKANPRDTTPPGKEESNRHRILRRGIPYGPEFVETEPPYGGGVTALPEQDRGLLFLCYQSSITRGFEFVQSQWANTHDFPQPADGRDPIISQDSEQGEFTLPGHPERLKLAHWVVTTGGGYFFSPSISAIGRLAGLAGGQA